MVNFAFCKQTWKLNLIQVPLKSHHLIMFGQRIKQRKKWKWEKVKRGAWRCNPLQWFWIVRCYVFNIHKKKKKVVFWTHSFLNPISEVFRKKTVRVKQKWNMPQGLSERRRSSGMTEVLSLLCTGILHLFLFAMLCGSQFGLKYWTSGPPLFWRWPI